MIWTTCRKPISIRNFRRTFSIREPSTSSESHVLGATEDEAARGGSFPLVTLVLIGANLIVAALVLGDERSAWRWGFIPTNPEVPAVLTALFVHINPTHLLGNMFFLAAVGPAVEQAAGSFRMLLVFLAGGISGTLLHFLMAPATQPLSAGKPLIGASSAIAGLVGYYWLRFYRLKVPILPRVRIPVYLVVVLWLGFEVVGALSDPEGTRGYWAHVGGFLAGFILALVFRAGSAAEMDEWRKTIEAATQMGPLARAEAVRQYLSRRPDDMRALRTLSEALLAAGDREGAMETLGKMTANDALFDDGYAIRRLVSIGATSTLPAIKRLVLARSLGAKHEDVASGLLESVLQDGSLEEKADALALMIEIHAVRNPERCRQYASQLQHEFALSPQLEAARAKRPELFD